MCTEENSTVSNHDSPFLANFDREIHTAQSGSSANSPETVPVLVMAVVVVRLAETEGTSRAPITSEADSLTASIDRRIVARRYPSRQVSGQSGALTL